MAHTSLGTLSDDLAKAASLVTVGSRYHHYKDQVKEYVVTDLAILEADESIAVLYRIANGQNPGFIWVRPLENFLDTVTVDGRSVPRFSKIID